MGLGTFREIELSRGCAKLKYFASNNNQTTTMQQQDRRRMNKRERSVIDVLMR